MSFYLKGRKEPEWHREIFKYSILPLKHLQLPKLNQTEATSPELNLILLLRWQGLNYLTLPAASWGAD